MTRGNRACERKNNNPACFLLTLHYSIYPCVRVQPKPEHLGSRETYHFFGTEALTQSKYVDWIHIFAPTELDFAFGSSSFQLFFLLPHHLILCFPSIVPTSHTCPHVAGPAGKHQWGWRDHIRSGFQGRDSLPSDVHHKASHPEASRREKVTRRLEGNESIN